MRTASRVLLVAAVVWLGGAAAASAADSCYLTGDGDLFVLKNFAQPTGANGCKSINGYIAFSACALSGNACRSADNVQIIFQTESSLFCSEEFFWTIETATNAGGITYCSDGTTDCFGSTIQKIPCPADRPFLAVF